MATSGLPPLVSNRHEKERKRRRSSKRSELLSDTGNIRYTSQKARRAYVELGIPVHDLLPPIQIRHIEERSHSPQKHEPSLTTSVQSTRQKSRKTKTVPAAALFIGKSKADYYTDTTRWPTATPQSKLPALQGFKILEMGRRDTKGILQQHKSTDNNKRVTFSESVRIEEFKPNSVIRKTKSPKRKSKNDVTKNNYAALKSDHDVINTNEDNGKFSSPKKVKNGSELDDRRNNGDNITNCVAEGDLVKKRENNCSERVLSDTTRFQVVIPHELPIDRENLSTSGTRDIIKTESRSLEKQIEATDTESKTCDEGSQSPLESNQTEQSGIPVLASLQETIHSEQSNTPVEVSPEASVEQGSDISSMDNPSDKNHSSSKINLYPRKTIKKRLSTNSMNLPAIREELSSNTRIVIPTQDNDDTNSHHSDDVFTNSKKCDVKETGDILTKDDVIKRVRDDARLSALKGQIAADKAAWSCVVHYPRRSNSQPGSGRSSPLTTESMRELTRRTVISPTERRNTFPLSTSPTLALYQPNYVSKQIALQRSLPPLRKPTRFSDSALVTQRNRPMWVPDVSFINKNSRHRVKIRGSNIRIYELRK